MVKERKLLYRDYIEPLEPKPEKKEKLKEKKARLDVKCFWVSGMKAHEDKKISTDL